MQAALASITALGLSACGKQSFETISTATVSEAPGYFALAPKVDIILAQDNTGSMKEIYPQIGSEVPRFLNNLANTGWDYHFAAVPLTPHRSGALFNQIVASKHDRNWGESNWLVPYPGALFTDVDPGQIASAFFRFPTNYTDYANNLAPNLSSSGSEPGLNTITNQLTNYMAGTGFHRDDAMLVVIVLGNGDDTSGRMICRRSDGVEGPCDRSDMSRGTIINCGSPAILSNGCQVGRALNTYASSYASDAAQSLRAHFRARLEALRPDPSQVTLHAAVATGGTCYSQGSYSGYQYSKFADEIGGTQQNFCASQTSTMLSTIQQTLETKRMSLFTVYLMTDVEPDESSIEVIRYPGGDTSRPVQIAKSTTNGWSYAGRIENEPRVVTAAGVPMNRATGWAVRLNGNARLTGYDTARVVYKPRGGS
ncbi:hypothetical protein EBZ37_03605 [bacterium]|nr:hypothetical protein [bacterium]